MKCVTGLGTVTVFQHKGFYVLVDCDFMRIVLMENESHLSTIIIRAFDAKKRFFFFLFFF